MYTYMPMRVICTCLIRGYRHLFNRRLQTPIPPELSSTTQTHAHDDERPPTSPPRHNRHNRHNSQHPHHQHPRIHARAYGILPFRAHIAESRARRRSIRGGGGLVFNIDGGAGAGAGAIIIIKDKSRWRWREKSRWMCRLMRERENRKRGWLLGKKRRGIELVGERMRMRLIRERREK